MQRVDFVSTLSANVKRNPSDFSSWQFFINEVINRVDSQTHEALDDAFNMFLGNYPYLHGYWNCYAQLKFKEERNEQVIVEIYERALQPLYYSVDMWCKYIDFMVHQSMGPMSRLRCLFNRAVEAVRLDNRSVFVWNKFVEFEKRHGLRYQLLSTYQRMLCSPLHNPDATWGALCMLVETSSVSDIGDAAVLTELFDVGSASNPEKAKHCSDLVEEGRMPYHQDDLESRAVSNLTKKDFLLICEQKKIEAQKIYEERVIFQSRIRRHYFHPKGLDLKQLSVWHIYIDFEEKTSDVQRIIAVYERCLIPCANYPELWVRYSLWMAAAVDTASGCAVLERATAYLTENPDVYLLHAEMLESGGYIDDARGVYDKVIEDVSPGLLEANLKFANFERRMGSFDEAASLYLKALSISNGHVKAHLALHYSQFQVKVLRNLNGARQSLETALEIVPLNKELLRTYFHVEAAQEREDTLARVSAIFQFALDREDNDLSWIDQKELWRTYKEYVGDNGQIIDVLQAEVLYDTQIQCKNSLSR